MIKHNFSSLETDILDVIDHPIVTVSQHGEIRYCNASIAKLFRVEINEIIGKNYFDICKKNNIQPVFSSIDNILNFDLNQNIITKHPYSTIQWHVAFLNNSNEDILLSGTDISSWINQFENAKEIQNSVIDHLPKHFIFWKDINLVYLGCNNALAHSLGFESKASIIGKTDLDLPTKKEESAKYRADDKEVMKSRQPKLDIEEDQTLPNGEKKILSTSKVPLFDNQGNVYGILAIYTDITDSKKAQEELKKSKEAAENALQSVKQAQVEEQQQRKEAERLNIENTKNKAELAIAKIAAEKEHEMRKTVMVLVGDIVHDLYTPISIIETGADALGSISAGLLQVIEEAKELQSKKLSLINNKKLHYVLNKMSIAQKDSIRMINEFIDTTIRELLVTQKYQDGTITHEELTKCSSRRVLENVMDSYPSREGIIINQLFSYDFFFMGNSILMMKVLFNLIRNAEEQIIANGKGEITITTEKTEDKNLLLVKDTAGGAPPEIVDNFFKEFFTTKKDGSGIGLAFCKKMMRNFGGDLTCHSIFGESMEFILSFPKIDDIQS